VIVCVGHVDCGGLARTGTGTIGLLTAVPATVMAARDDLPCRAAAAQQSARTGTGTILGDAGLERCGTGTAGLGRLLDWDRHDSARFCEEP